MLNYLVIDCENDNSDKYERKAGNFLYDPIVAIGIKELQYEVVAVYFDDSDEDVDFIWPNAQIIVGHNIKHDLLFLWNIPQLQTWLQQGGQIWDTQLVEYIITGHQSRYAALRDLAVNKYGCIAREKLMEKYWDQGFKTSEIPKDMVLEDVKNDVLDTEQIYLKQLEIVKSQGQQMLIKTQMDGLLATIEMEYNGMKISLDTLEANKLQLQAKLEEKQAQLLELVRPYWRIV